MSGGSWAHHDAGVRQIIRDAVTRALADAAAGLTELAAREFEARGPRDARGAGVWDSAAWLRERAARIEAER